MRRAPALRLALLRATAEFLERCLDGGWQWAEQQPGSGVTAALEQATTAAPVATPVPLPLAAAPQPTTVVYYPQPQPPPGPGYFRHDFANDLILPTATHGPMACPPRARGPSDTPSLRAVYDRAYNAGRQDGYGEGSLAHWHDGYARGQQEGHGQGHAEGLACGQQEGYTHGQQEGHGRGTHEGYEQGQASGYERGWAGATERAAEAAAEAAKAAKALAAKQVEEAKALVEAELKLQAAQELALRETHLHAQHTREITDAKIAAADELHRLREEMTAALEASRAEVASLDEKAARLLIEGEERAKAQLEEGFAEGKAAGKQVGREEGYGQGRTDGFTYGRHEGYSHGKNDGYTEGLQARDVELSTVKAEAQALRSAAEAAKSNAEAAKTELTSLEAARDRLHVELDAQARSNITLQHSLTDAYDQGHLDGIYDERAAFDLHASSLQAAMPRYARTPPVVEAAPPPRRPIWRPSGRLQATPGEHAARAARSPSSSPPVAVHVAEYATPVAPRPSPHAAARWATRSDLIRHASDPAEILRRTADDLATLRL